MTGNPSIIENPSQGKYLCKSLIIDGANTR